MNFFINRPQKRVFRYVSLSNLENVLQKIQKQTTRECISRVSGGTNFEHSSNRASRDGAFMGSVFVPAAQKFSGYVTSLMSQVEWRKLILDWIEIAWSKDYSE